MRRKTLLVLSVLVAALYLSTSIAQSSPLAAPGQSAFGINSHIATRYPDESTLDIPAQLLAQAEVGWVREDFQMSWLEPQRDTFDWRFHDTAVEQLAVR